MTSTPPPTPPLSPAQVSVIAAYARGATSSSQVSAQLGISDRAIRGHIQRAARRAGITGRPLPALVDYAYRHRYFDDIPDLAITNRATPSRLRLPGSQRRTLQCLAQGMSTGATARELGVKRETAREYRNRLYARLGTVYAYRAVALGWQHGILGQARALEEATRR